MRERRHPATSSRMPAPMPMMDWNWNGMCARASQTPAEASATQREAEQSLQCWRIYVCKWCRHQRRHSIAPIDDNAKYCGRVGMRAKKIYVSGFIDGGSVNLAFDWLWMLLLLLASSPPPERATSESAINRGRVFTLQHEICANRKIEMLC